MKNTGYHYQNSPINTMEVIIFIMKPKGKCTHSIIKKM